MGARTPDPGLRTPVADRLFSAGDAKRLAKRLAHLRGAVLKLRQMGSMDGNDGLVPGLFRVLGSPSNQARFPPLSQHFAVPVSGLGGDWNQSFPRLVLSVWRALGKDLQLRRRFKRHPALETPLLHRKMVGIFNLCPRLRAPIRMPRLLADMDRPVPATLTQRGGPALG